MKVLNIIVCAYRATFEEQDDTIVWLVRAMQKIEGADLAVLLTGAAVNYLVAGQDCDGLRIGSWRQTQPPAVRADLRDLMARGVEVYYLREDQLAIGLDSAELLEGAMPIATVALPRLFESVNQVWHW